MIVVKVGGCNGSGKTSLVRALLAQHSCTPVPGAEGTTLGRRGRPEAYVAKLDPATHHGLRRLVVLGSYETACGGMDTISDKHERMALVQRWAVRGNLVVFEGLMTGKTYGALGALSEERYHKGRWLYVLVDTPFAVCVERVLQRRQAAGNDAPFDPERTMRSTHKGCESAAQRAYGNGHRVLRLNHTEPPKKLATRLHKAALELARDNLKGAGK